MPKYLQTFESFWKANKFSEKPYYCEEFNDLYDLYTFIEDGKSPFKDIHYNSMVDRGFDKEEKREFCLFIGDCAYLTNNRVSVLTYEFEKKFGFGLSDNTITKHKFNINKKSTHSDNHFYVMNYLYKENGDNEIKYYLCNTLDSCMSKIKKIKKTTMAYA